MSTTESSRAEKGRGVQPLPLSKPLRANLRHVRREIQGSKMVRHQQKFARYDAGNLEAARIIAADPVKYPSGSLPAIWVAMVLKPPAERTAPAAGRAA